MSYQITVITDVMLKALFIAAALCAVRFFRTVNKIRKDIDKEEDEDGRFNL